MNHKFILIKRLVIDNKVSTHLNGESLNQYECQKCGLVLDDWDCGDKIYHVKDTIEATGESLPYLTCNEYYVYRILT
jgi:transcription initiation factor IIE alpha subunit